MKIALFAVIVSVASANGDRLSANSVYGQRLLRHAQVIEEPERRAAEQKNGLDVGAMYIQYEGCSSYQDYGQDQYYNQNYYNQNGQQNGGNRDLENYNYNYNNGGQQQNGNQQWGGLNTVNLVRFTLCTDTKCGSCRGKYAVDMNEFLLAYDEHNTAETELKCANIAKQCTCNTNYQGDDAETACLNSCYKQAGASKCLITYDKNGDAVETFPLDEYVQCKQMDYYPSGYANYQVNKNSQVAGYYNEETYNGNNKGIFYVGPYCKDASEIYLGTFLDNTCTYAATHATFSSKYQGQSGESFPYFTKPIISAGKCMMCQDEEEYYNAVATNSEAIQQSQQEYQKNQNYNKYYSSNSYANNNGNSNSKYNQQYQYNNYYYQQAQQNQAAAAEQKTPNSMCAFAAYDGNDDVLKCTQVDYDGCLFLEMLPDLDGRNAAKFSAASVKLDWEQNYTVVLGVLAAVLGMVIMALAFCDPTSIPEKRSALLHDVHADNDDATKPSISMNQSMKSITQNQSMRSIHQNQSMRSINQNQSMRSVNQNPLPDVA